MEAEEQDEADDILTADDRLSHHICSGDGRGCLRDLNAAPIKCRNASYPCDRQPYPRLRGKVNRFYSVPDAI